LRKRSYIKKNTRIIVLLVFIFFNLTTLPTFSATFYLLKDYYNIINIGYHTLYTQIPYHNLILNNESYDDFSYLSDPLKRFQLDRNDSLSELNLNLEGEIQLNLSYGGDFSLKKGVIVGAGSEGINSGLRYDLIEKILLEGRIGERLFLEFDYDSERSEEGLGEESNIYSIVYKGKEDEFLKEATIYLLMKETLIHLLLQERQDGEISRLKD